MLCQRLKFCLNFLTVFYCVIGENVSVKNEKRPENGLQICIESFDIHKDKIIRTEDSREMGAKYLNEIDLDSQKECLRLCCETDQCDVFVFEEKRPGSCYLFHCGPPDDFKCKFTNHANYSSAVLTTNINSQSTAELEEQIRRTQHVHELESLRKLADSAPAEYSVPEPTAIPLVTEAPKASTSTTPVLIKSGCSRNQFECRTSGDCIAIYNACDGIPQCADGSDEATELGCPTERPTLPSAPVIQQSLPPPQDSLKYQETIQNHKPYSSLYGQRQEKDSKQWQPPVASHQQIPQQQRLQYPQQAAIPQSQMNLGPQGYQWDYQPLYEQNKGTYNSMNQFRGQNNLGAYEQEQPHIFNHKGPGVIGENAEGGAYMDPSRQYGSYFPPDHGVWQEGQNQPPPSIVPPFQRSQPVPPQLEPKITAPPPPCKPDEKQAEVLSKVDREKSVESELQKPFNIQKATNEIDERPITVERGHTKHNAPQTDEPQKHKEHKAVGERSRVPERNHLAPERLQQENSEDKVLRPKGAVISLALGLTATAMMAALIACRLRVVRRRGRRGHGPYAHDADYLVNGMYL